MLKLIFTAEKGVIHNGGKALAEKVQGLEALAECSLDTDSIISAIKACDFDPSITSVQVDIEGKEPFELVVNEPVLAA